MNNTSKRKTNEEFVAEVRNLVSNEYTFLEPYVNNRTKLKVCHNTCGHTYYVSPSNFLIHKSRCPYCAPNVLKDQDTFVKQINQRYGNHYTVLEKYNGDHRPIKMKCNVCGHIWEPLPTNLLAGRSCPVCSNQRMRQKLNKSNKQFIADVTKQVGNEYTFLDPYVSQLPRVKTRGL